MQSNKLSAIVGVLLVLGVCNRGLVAAQRSFECELVWKGPSRNNDPIECIFDTYRIQKQMKYFTPAIISGIIVVLLLCFLPFVMCSMCRWWKFRNPPKEANASVGVTSTLEKEFAQRRHSQRILLLLFAIMLLGTTAVLFCLILGSVLLQRSVLSTEHLLASGPVAGFRTLSLTIKNFIKKTTIADLDLSFLSTLEGDIENTLDDVHEKYYWIVNLLVGVFVGAGVSAFLLFTGVLLLTAFWRESIALSRPTTCIGYSFALVFMIFSVVMSVVAVFLSSLCGEITVQSARQPGIGQWYAVPLLNYYLSLQPLLSFTKSKVEQAVIEGCTALGNSTTCMNNSACRLLVKQKPCSMISSWATNASTLSSLPIRNLGYLGGTVNSSIEEKENSEFFICSKVLPLDGLDVFYTESEVKGSKGLCSLNSDEEMEIIPGYVEEPSRILSVLDQYWMEALRNIDTGFSYLKPLINANFLIDFVASVLETPSHPGDHMFYSTHHSADCTNLRQGVWMIFSGFFIGGFAFASIFAVSIFAPIQMNRKKNSIPSYSPPPNTLKTVPNNTEDLKESE